MATMSRPKHAALYVVALTVAGAAGGFALGHLGGTDATSLLDPAETERLVQAETALRAKVTALEQERDHLRQQVKDLASASRTALAPAPTSGNQQPQGNPGMGMGMGMGRAGSTAAKKVKKEPPDPDKAAALLAQLKAALDAGKAEELGEMAEDLAGQSELLVPELTALLEQAESLFAMENLATLLGEMGDKRALSSLQTLLKNEASDAVRTAAVRALGRIPDPSSVPLLTAEFGRESGSPMPPSLAASALGNIGTKQAIASLQKEVQAGSNGMVRAFAVRALAGRKDPALVPFFLEQVRRKGGSERYRRQAIEAIAATGDKNAIWPLQQIALAPESGRAVQEAAKRAINKLAGRKLYQVR
jgi:hypothetical protein